MNVRIESMTLRNFKGCESQLIRFGKSVTKISGRNASGKTRTMDAFLWCLFGKDSNDRKDYEVKTYDANGEQLHECECSVECVMDVDGKPMKFKRSLVEEWVKPKGQAKRVFKGNHVEYFINDVPMQAGAYNEQVSALCNPDLFKTISNPLFFTSLNWSKQRQMLFSMIKPMTNDDIVAMNPELTAILNKMGDTNADDYKKMLQAKKKKVNEELNEIQPRIDQTNSLMPLIPDTFPSVESVDKEIEKVSSQKVTNEPSEKIEVMLSEISAIHTECTKRFDKWFEKKTDDRNETHESLAAESRKRTELFDGIYDIDREIERHTTQLGILKVDIEAARKEFEQVKNMDFSKMELVCPTCGQKIPKADAEKKRGEMAQNAIKHQNELLSQAADIKKRYKMLKESIETLTEKKAKLKEEAENAKNECDRLRLLVDSLDTELVMCKSSSFMTDEEQKKVEELKECINKEKEKSVNINSANEEIAQKIAELGKIKEKFAQRDVLTEKIADLKEYGKDLAQQLADIEKKEYMLQELTRIRIDDAVRQVNGMFEKTTWKLFNYTIEGNPVETCEAMYDGRPFGALNNAMKINIGLDIIKTFCRHYNAFLPIFIDNAESVNELTNTESQQIRMYVSEKDYEVLLF